MKGRLLSYWYALQQSYWFVPVLFLMFAVLAAFGLAAADHLFREPWPGVLSELGITTTSAVRTLLAAVAGAMITIVSLVFSVTMVVLVLAGSQFGPNLIQIFMGKLSTKLVLGLYIGTFLYCLLALVLVPYKTPVPRYTALGAIFVGIAGIVALVFFFNEVARSIQAENLISTVAKKLDKAIERLAPRSASAEAGHEDNSPDLHPHLETFTSRQILTAAGEGYVESVDYRELAAQASNFEGFVRVRVRANHFVVRGSEIATVRTVEPLDAATLTHLHAAFLYGWQRTALQDVEFYISQLVEMAVRALSPGINGQSIAIACIDRLGAALSRLGERSPLPALYRDAAGAVRVLANTTDFAGYLSAAFSQIRQNARGDTAVLTRMLESLAVLARIVTTQTGRKALTEHADMVRKDALEAAEGPDRDDIEKRYKDFSTALESEPVPRKAVE